MSKKQDDDNYFSAAFFSLLQRMNITPKVFLKEVKCLRILKWTDQQVSS